MSNSAEVSGMHQSPCLTNSMRCPEGYLYLTLPLRQFLCVAAIFFLPLLYQMIYSNETASKLSCKQVDRVASC